MTEPERAPAAVGVKFTLTVQVALGATLDPEAQVLLAMLKSVPMTAVAPRTSAAVPEFVSVNERAVLAPTVVDA